MILVGLVVLLLIIGLPLGYLCLLSVLALTLKPGGVRAAGRNKVFAVVVPARDEELQIARTVRSLRGLEYPAECFDVIVVADNCSDRTALLARAEGAMVLERSSDTGRGKGYALRWCFDRILTPPSRYDAVVVCDADSVADAQLLEVFNAYLDRGAVAIQCNDQVQSAPDAWSSEATRLGLLLYNYARPAGRKQLGLSAGLRGNGMCFSAGLLQSHPWNAYSRNEDLEYALDLLLHNVGITFAPEATVLATMPRDARNAESQRTRWERGRFSIIAKYATALLAQAVKQQSVVILDGLIDLLTPALLNLMAGAAAMACISVLLWWAGVESMQVVTLVWLGVVGLGVAHVLFGVLAADHQRGGLRLLRHVPRYAVWKLGLYARMLTSKDSKDWVRTTRELLPAARKEGKP